MGGAHPALDGNHFDIQTDHEAFRLIYNTTDPSSRLMWWRLRLAAFSFDALHKPTANHHLADFMSRAESSSPADDDIDDEVPCHALAEMARGLKRGRYVRYPKLTPVDHHDLAKAQRTDSLCGVIRQKIQDCKAKTFFTRDGTLYGRADDLEQLVVPHQQCERLMQLQHYLKTEGHRSTNRTYHVMRRRFCWPSMATDIYGFVTKCATCALSRLALRKHTAPLKVCWSAGA